MSELGEFGSAQHPLLAPPTLLMSEKNSMKDCISFFGEELLSRLRPIDRKLIESFYLDASHEPSIGVADLWSRKYWSRTWVCLFHQKSGEST